MKELKVELKKIQTFRGHDGQGFNAEVYINGVNCFHVHDGAYGGDLEYTYHTYNVHQTKKEQINNLVAELEAYIKTLEPVKIGEHSIKMDMDLYIEDLLNKIEDEKQFNKIQKTWIITNKSKNGWEGFNLKKPLGNFSKQSLCNYLNRLMMEKHNILNTNLTELGIKIENGKATYSMIRFAKKGDNKLKSFWVERYNDEERDFFLSLGFKERIDPTPKEFQDNPHGNTLNYDGTGSFGFWSDAEAKRIHDAVKKKFNLKKVPVYEYQFHELI